MPGQHISPRPRVRHRLAQALRAGSIIVGAAMASAPALAQQQGGGAQPVTLAVAAAKVMAVQLRGIGTVQPFNAAAVRPRVEGQVLKQHFSEGQTVREGDILFTLDVRAAEVQLVQAQANLARDQAQLSRALSELRRYGELHRAGTVSPQQYEQAKANAEGLEAAVKSSQAAIAAARLVIDYATVRAPIAGRTGEAHLKLGGLAKPGDGTSLVTVTQFDPIAVAFTLPERDLPAVLRAQAAGAVPVAAEVPGGATAEGRLVFIGSSVDSASGTIAMKASFANAEARLWPGQFVKVAVTVGIDRDAVVIPGEAVQQGQSGNFVFVARAEGVAEMRQVKVARVVDGQAVIAEGVKPGERVVTEGQMRLADGTPLRERGK